MGFIAHTLFLCHPEHSEGSRYILAGRSEILHYVQNDKKRCNLCSPGEYLLVDSINHTTFKDGYTA